MVLVKDELQTVKVLSKYQFLAYLFGYLYKAKASRCSVCYYREVLQSNFRPSTLETSKSLADFKLSNPIYRTNFQIFKNLSIIA